MCFIPNLPFKAETSILGIYFIAFVHVLLPFSDFNAFFGWLKLDFVGLLVCHMFSISFVKPVQINLIL